MTAFTAVCHPNYQYLQKVGYDIVIFNCNVLGHAWHTWCKNLEGYQWKEDELLFTCRLNANIQIDFRTMGLWIWITFFWYALYNTNGDWYGFVQWYKILHSIQRGFASLNRTSIFLRPYAKSCTIARSTIRHLYTVKYTFVKCSF